MKKKKLSLIANLILICAVASAQGLYSKSLGVTEITGVYKEVNEMPNVIASNTNPDIVAKNFHQWQNLSLLYTQKMDFQGKTWYIWVITHQIESASDKSSFDMVDFLALTAKQNEQLRLLSSEVSLTKIPTYATSPIVVSLRPESIVEEIKRAILEQDDIMADTSRLTAKKVGDSVHFLYDYDDWTHPGDVTKRTYHKLDLSNNYYDGYFKISVEQWERLFYR